MKNVGKENFFFLRWGDEVLEQKLTLKCDGKSEKEKEEKKKDKKNVAAEW